MPLPVLYAAGVSALDDRAAGSHKNQPPAPGEDAHGTGGRNRSQYAIRQIIIYEKKGCASQRSYSTGSRSLLVCLPPGRRHGRSARDRGRRSRW